MNSEPAVRPGWLTGLLVVLVTGTVVAGGWLTAFSTERSQRAQEWSELAHLATEDLLAAHLWLEEAVGGDQTVDVQAQVFGPLDRASQECVVLRDGSTSGPDDVSPLGDQPAGRALGRLCPEIDRLATLAEERLASSPSEGGIGSARDTAFDREFESVMAMLDQLSANIGVLQAIDRDTVEQAGYTITGFLALLLVGIVTVGRLHSRSVAELGRRNAVVLEAAGEGILGLDRHGIGQFANPAAARLTGRGQDELAGADVHALLHGDTDDRHTAQECPLRRSVDAGERREAGEDVFRRADGSEFPAEYTLTRVDRDGAASGAVIVFRDVTARRAAEELKDQFISVVSHELRTPLTSIHGSLGLLAGGAVGDLPASAQRMLDIATTNTDRLVRLINDILDLERMRLGEVRMDRRVLDANEPVEQAVASLHGMAADAGVEVIVAPQPALVWADHDRLVQVLVNLVSNAVKFSDPGGEVEVVVSVVDDEVLFSVLDRGRGIPEDQLDTVFGRFQQVDASDSREKGGTGLGLAISESIVVQQEGRIWAERRAGGGTAVRFILPHVSPSASGTRRGGGGATVLVVDDDPELLEVVCSILEREGYHAVPAASGQEAIRRAMAVRPDAVVLDLLMPTTDGWEVLARLREHEQTADVPVVILSVLSEGDQTRPTDDYDGWVAKPFPGDELLGAIGEALRPSRERLRAVVVEDDASLAAVLVATFERHTIEAIHVATASQARTVIPGFAPDLVVLDLHLPDGDGVEVLHDLRTGGHLRGVPVVVYTGHDIEPGDRDRLERNGAVVVTKTRVSPAEFEDRVLDLLGVLVDPVA